MTRPRRADWLVVVSGVVICLAFGAIGLGQLPLGSRWFFVALASAALAYLIVLLTVREVRLSRTAMVACIVATVAMRVPMAVIPVGAGSDAFRYIWDARLQRAGLNPYTAIPDDPALAFLHTNATRKMNNMGVPSPYPPLAQLFFRSVTAIDESVFAFKGALIACDLLTALLLVGWLRSRAGNPWLALAYAWNPLVVLETSLSAHLDVLGALSVTCAVVSLHARRRMLAATALAAGIGIKFLPVVLVPLLWRRIRVRDAAVGVVLLIAVYVPFSSADALPVGSVVEVIRRFRFNAPAFAAIEWLAGAWLASAAAVGAGFLSAALLRASRFGDDPAAWAWPMALVLMLSPLVYPWYLIWLAPFFFSPLSLPLLIWSLSILPTYAVWELFRQGARWAVPSSILAVEFGAVLIGVLVVTVRLRRTRRDERAGAQIVLR